MAVDIGQIVSSALGGAESSFARKEQRMGLAEQRRSNTRRELNNRAINSGLYTLDDTGNLHVDIKKAYESPESKAVLLDILNTSASGAANYKDLNNQIKNGTFADLPKVVDAGDGTANFVGEIKKEDGSIEPLTENRSSSPNDNPALIDAASLELLAEGAFLNSMGEFGIDGTAVAVLQNLNFNTPTVRAQEGVVNALRDEKDPAALTQLIGQLGPTIKQTDPNRGNVTVDDLGGKAATLNQTATDAVEKQEPTNVRDKVLQKNMERREKLKEKRKIDAKKRQLDSRILTKERRAEIEQELAELENPAATETQQPTDGFDLDFDVSEIPTDVEGATKWFSDKANTDSIDQLDPDKVAKVREFLESKNINSKKELVDAVKQGEVSANQARSIARITAWSVVDKNGQKDAQLSANIYSGFINEMQTGNPDVTPTQMANAETSRGTLDLARSKFVQELDDDRFDKIISLYETAGKEGFDSPEFTQQLKAQAIPFLKDKRFDQLTQKDKAAMDGILSQVFLNAADNQFSGSTGIEDWFMDIFRGEADPTLGNAMDNVAIKYDKPGPDGKPVELVFLRTRGGSQVEADQSISWNNVTELVGQGELANYILSRAKRR